MADKFEVSLEGGVHASMQKMTGTWKGTTRVWFGPGNPVDEGAAEGTITGILGGRFLLHEYKGSLMGKPLDGIAICGYHLQSGKFQSAWIDSEHMGTGILFSETKAPGKNFDVTGSWSPDNVQQWGWRTEMALNGDDELVITAYIIKPEGEESKATETVYTRVK